LDREYERGEESLMGVTEVSKCIVLVGGSMLDIGLEGGYEALDGSNGKKKHWKDRRGA
jgi:hypothetical protein